MDEPGSHFGWLNDPRLATHALSPVPAWLWATDPPRILWANPVAAAIFDTPSPAAAAALNFAPDDAAARQIARLSSTLPDGGPPRLERLRGFGASFGGTSICLCSRFKLQNGRMALLVLATERPPNGLALPERVHRLLADLQIPSAVFGADGDLIEAQPAAAERLADKRDLIALDAVKLAEEATRADRAQGEIGEARVDLIKLGAGPTFALLLGLLDLPAMQAEPIVPPTPTPVATNTHVRRQSFRFVWQMDANLCFTLGAPEFARLLGPKTASTLDRPWHDMATTLGIDGDGRVAHALEARETWSGIVLDWPVDDSNEPLPIEMSGLPVFDRDRQFAGYRGFGICRDLDRLAALRREREAAPKVTAPERTREEPIDNVLPFPLPPPPETVVAPPRAENGKHGAIEQPELTPVEHSAFQELARELNARLKNPAASNPELQEGPIQPFIAPAPPASRGAPAQDTQDTRTILDRVPIGILVYRLSTLLYANRAFLDWTGYENLDALAESGGLDALFIETSEAPAEGRNGNGAKALTIATVNGSQKPVEGRLFSVAWSGENALVLMINTQAREDAAPRAAADAALRRLESENSELKAVLDTATDGVLMLDRAGRILAANRSAEALFGYEARELVEMSLGDLFAVESRRSVLDALERLARAEGARALDPGREAIGRVRRGGLIPLYITMGRIENGEKVCAVLRDITAWKRSEEELINARQDAERASTAKSEFLAKISHEIRTPLNAIIGFSEVMMEERFGAVGNERYRQYLKDIHASGGHLISLLNDLLDLSKIEAGKLDLNFVTVNLNDIVQQCVAIMQQEANRNRVIVRTALHPNLPPIVADARSVRQIALNLLSNSVKFTGAGGQIIVSTAVNEDHEVSLRVRDTGTGMSEKELQTALEPFRQLTTSPRWGGSGTGLGLPITKALAEANHARFRITSEVDNGTLVEVAFPATRVLAN
jgi:PAS domain S-box-containing protein